MSADENKKLVENNNGGEFSSDQSGVAAGRLDRVVGALATEAGSEILENLLIEGDEKARAELEESKQEIREVLENNREKIDTDVIKRAERDIYFADEVEKMASGQEFDKNALAGVLERRMWGSFFNNLKTGDRIVSFLVPGADFLSIKNLNDKIVGPQITNKIIEQKRRVLEEKIKNIDPEATLLQSDYKTEVIKLSPDSEIDNKQLESVMAEVDREMQDFITTIINNLLRTDEEKNKAAILKEFLDDLHGKSGKGKGGFKMNYGLAIVEGNEAKDQLLALDHSLQTSRMAREAKDGSYGSEYNESETLAEVDKIRDLRKTIIGLGNSIEDEQGNKFEIFTKSEKEDKYIFNRDLLRDVRKNKFKTEDKKLMESIVLYVKKLNILDAVKLFTYDEVEKVRASAVSSRQLADKVKTGQLSDKERQEVANILRSDEKAPEYTDKTGFHERAVDMEDAVYISMDVLDLGVDLLREYESTLQDVENTPQDKRLEKFNEVSLRAGDVTTEKLRRFRSDVARVYRDFGLGNGLVVAEVGGDELNIAVDMKDLMKNETDESKKEEKLNKLLFALKKATNTRVIKTVVAETEKDISNESNQHDRVEAHLQAIKRAEAGAVIAKDLEEAARKLTRLLNKSGKEAVIKKLDGLNGVFVIVDNEIKSNFVIMDNDKGFKIANSNKDEFSYDTIKNDLDTILGRKAS